MAETNDSATDAVLAVPEENDTFDLTDPAISIFEHMALLEFYMDSLAASFSNALGEYLRCPIKVSSSSPVIGKYNPISHEQPAFDRMFRLKAIQGTIAVALPEELIFKLVDVFFGGDGATSIDSARSELSATESNMLDKLAYLFANGVLTLLQERAVSATDLSIEEWSHKNAAIEGKSESMIAVKFALSLNEYVSEIEAWLSLPVLELLLGVKLLPYQDGSSSEPGWSKRLKQNVFESQLEVICSFADRTIPLKKVKQLQVGDFIPLNAIDEATFSVGKKQLFKARVGVSNDKASAEFLNWL